MPDFHPDGGPALVLARGLAVACILSVAGTATFRTVVLPRVCAQMTPADADRIERALLRWLRACATVACLGLLAWLVAVTANLASPAGIADWHGGLWTVLADTDFGRVLTVQAALLVGAVLSLGWRPGNLRWRICLVLATTAAVAETGHGHAYAMAQGISVLEVSEVLHLWAAGAWLGGLAPLLLVVVLAPSAAAAAARWFSPLGKVTVVVLAVTAFVQSRVLIASVAALRDTAYGWTAMLKLSLFGVLFGFAVLNRYRLCPALRRPPVDAARRALIVSLALQTGCGLLVVLAAALLGQLEPGMDMMLGSGVGG